MLNIRISKAAFMKAAPVLPIDKFRTCNGVFPTVSHSERRVKGVPTDCPPCSSSVDIITKDKQVRVLPLRLLGKTEEKLFKTHGP